MIEFELLKDLIYIAGVFLNFPEATYLLLSILALGIVLSLLRKRYI